MFQALYTGIVEYFWPRATLKGNRGLCCHIKNSMEQNKNSMRNICVFQRIVCEQNCYKSYKSDPNGTKIVTNKTKSNLTSTKSFVKISFKWNKTRPNEFGSMTLRKDHISQNQNVAIKGPCKTIQKPCNTIKDHILTLWTRDFLFHLKQFGREHFCSIWNIFCSWFPVSNKKNKASIRTFEHIARGQKRSGTQIVPR